MNIDYYQKYLKYKTKYIQLQNNQKGGGSWNYFTFNNDQTHDALTKFRDNNGIYYGNDKIIKILDSMFEEYFDDVLRKLKTKF